MATLTQTYQRLGETRYSAGNASGLLVIYGRCDSQSITDNKSYVSFKITTYTTVGSYYSSSNSTNLNCAGNRGTQYFDIGTVNETERTLGTWSFALTHGNDGNYNGSASGWADVYSGVVPSVSCSFSLPRIKRQALMASANDFTDEENPSMTYIYYDEVDFQVNAYLEVNGTRFKTVEDIGNVGSYTFELTTSERNQLRQLCTGQSMTVRYGVATLINSQTENYWNYMDRTMTMVNATPTLTYSVVETNNKVISLLGGSSANTIISNASNLQFTVTPTTYKYATVTNVTVDDGINPQQEDTSPYVLNLPVRTSNTFSIKVKDSRQYEASQSDTSRTLIDYLAVAINGYSFKRQAPTSSNVIFNGEFTYWGNVGSYTNTPVVKYKLGSGSWVTIPSTNYTIDSTNHKLTINNYTISNILSYQTPGQFSISIEDILTSQEDTSDKGKVLKGIPTFDAGEHDLKVNGDLYIADTTGSNAINVKDELNKIDNLKGTQIYYNSSGTNGNVNLSDSVANYDYIEVYFRNNDNFYSYSRFYDINSKYICLMSTAIDGSNQLRLKTANYYVNGSSMTFQRGSDYNITARAGDVGTNTKVVYVTKVIGYNED